MSPSEKDRAQCRRITVIHSSNSISKIIYCINEEFGISSPIRLYSFYGREIFDSSDLKYLEIPTEYNKIIFFCEENVFSAVNIDYYRLKCYKMLKKLGEGGFGKVYLAEQKFSKELLAIKFLKLRSSKCFKI